MALAIPLFVVRIAVEDADPGEDGRIAPADRTCRPHRRWIDSGRSPEGRRGDKADRDGVGSGRSCPNVHVSGPERGMGEWPDHPSQLGRLKALEEAMRKRGVEPAEGV